VEEQSAKYFGSSNRVQNVGLAVDHSGLNKFGSRTAEYEIIRGTLVALLPPTPQDIYSVPAQRVGTYTSRDMLSQRIRETLRPPTLDGDDSDAGEFRALIIHGMGGVGKTQLALNFIQENREHYSPILWIDAHTPETVRLSFERGAIALGLTFDTTSTSDSPLKDFPVVTRMLRWFFERDEGDRRWLVVVDNADDTSWNVQEIIPQGSRGHVIVTSQHPQSSRFLGGRCERVDVSNMALSEARALLQKHMGVKSEQASVDIDDLCDQLVNRLGCLALAVDLAGAYLTEQLDFHDGKEVLEAVLRRYLVDYDQHQDELLRWEPFYRLSSYEKTVWTVWDTSLAVIDKTSPGSHASRVLTFLAHFDQGRMEEEMFRLASAGWPVMADLLRLPEEVVPEWLRKMVASKGERWDDFHYRQATQPLIRYGLLQRLGGNWAGTTMHGLVQWRARRAHLDSSMTWAWWRWLFMMAAVCQTNREKDRPQFRRHVIAHLLGMVEIDLDIGLEMDLDEKRTASLWAELGEAYYDEGRWAEAEELVVRVMETRTRVLGKEHPDTLSSMANLAATYRDQGRWTEAEELDVRVMETSTRVLGKEHPDTLCSMANLAATYRNQGRWTEAEKLDVRVMETRMRVLGKEHPDTLSSMANLAATYWNQGRWTEAEELEVRVMETRTRVLGEEHPDTLSSMANLAATYWNQGRRTEAEELEMRVMETRTRVLGEEHPDTLSSMANLATTYWNQGRWTEAEELEVRVMETRTRVLGEEHPDTLSSMANLAATYRDQGRWTEAEELDVRVMETSTRVLEKEHPDTLSSMANLATTYRNQGRWTEAEELEVRVMETRTRVLGEEHPDTLGSMANLAATYWNQERWTEAEELEMRVMETRTRVLGEEHPDTLGSMANLAATYRDQGRWTEAEELKVRVMETRTRVLKEEHPDTLSSMANLAATYRDQGRWTEAEELEVRVMETRTRVLGEEHPGTLTSMANLAATYWNQGRWTETEELEVRVMETSTRVLGEEHPDTLTSMDSLAYTWKMQGRQQDAVALMDRCVSLRTQRLGVDHPHTANSLETLREWQSELKSSLTEAKEI
jgi:tetratricopeptide (TPR) repeat protein